MKSLVLALTASILAAGSANAGMTFVESYTDATLGDGDDTVLTVVGVGYAPSSNLEGVIGVGYDEASDAVALRGQVRYYKYLGNNFTLEGGIEGVYYTRDNDEFEVRPELRIRRYF